MKDELLKISRIRDTDKLQTSIHDFKEKYNDVTISLYSEYKVDELRYKRTIKLSDLNRFDIIFGNQGFEKESIFKRLILIVSISNTNYEYSIYPNNI